MRDEPRSQTLPRYKGSDRLERRARTGSMYVLSWQTHVVVGGRREDCRCKPGIPRGGSRGTIAPLELPSHTFQSGATPGGMSWEDETEARRVQADDVECHLEYLGDLRASTEHFRICLGLARLGQIDDDMSISHLAPRYFDPSSFPRILIH